MAGAQALADVPGVGIIVFGHGSRDVLWRLPMEAVAARVRQRMPGAAVRCAYLELQAPSLPEAAAELAGLALQAVRVLPMFLGAGRHVRQDLPRLMLELRQRHPLVRWELLAPVGESDRVVDLLASLAVGEAAP